LVDYHNPERLRHEVSVLHWTVFQRAVPEQVIQLYIQAHCTVMSQLDIAQSRWLERIIEKEQDLEALEFGLRNREPDHVLCQKLKLLIYIAEAFPEYYSDFVNESPRRGSAFCSLVLHTIRTVGKQLKAWWLLRRFL
jgi:hypothetical protein